MSEIPFNKFEKRDLILRLWDEGKTYREICHIAHVSPRDIKPIAKEYDRKKRLETNITIKNIPKPLKATFNAFLIGLIPVIADNIIN